MDVKKENSKIAKIISDEKFSYRGLTWLLDLPATYGDPKNKALQGAPIMMLTGTRESGESIRIWSHDVEAIGDPVVFAPVGTPPVVEEPIEPPKKTAVKKPSKGKKKQ